MELKIKKMRDNFILPQKMSELAAGHDLFVSDIEQVEPDFVICRLGFAATPPPGYKIVFVPRSSLTKTRWIITNSPTQGDEDYTGEYQLRFRCIPKPGFQDPDNGKYFYYEKVMYDPFPYNVGDRIGQMFIEKVNHFEFIEVDELEDTERGDGAYGSTGIK
jgi:dUTP pyrophosphatase